jgi:hypothetical protein
MQIMLCAGDECHVLPVWSHRIMYGMRSKGLLLSMVSRNPGRRDKNPPAVKHTNMCVYVNKIHKPVRDLKLINMCAD